MRNDGITVATTLGYPITKSDVQACIEQLKRYMESCQAFVTRAVVFVLVEDNVKFAEDIIEAAGLDHLVEVCPSETLSLNPEYLAGEYARAHGRKVVCIH